MHWRRTVMRYEDNDDPKKPHPVEIWRKGDNAAEDQEHGPSEVEPDGRGRGERYSHMHVRC